MSLSSKERLVSEPKTASIVEIPDEPEIAPEHFSDYVQKVEQNVTLNKPVVDDNGQVIVSNTLPDSVTIKLPLTDDQMQQALHLKVAYSLRWLAEWSKRLVKMMGGKFTYQVKS